MVKKKKWYLMAGLFVLGYAMGYWQANDQLQLLPPSILQATLGAFPF